MKKYNITTNILRYVAMSLMLTAIMTVTNSCESTELELLNDPSSLSPEQASEDLFINNIQLGVAAFFDGDNSDNFDGASEVGMEVTRMIAMIAGNTYQNAYTPFSMNGIYRDAYSKTMIDIKTLSPLAEEKGLYTHLGMAQVIESYIMMTMVDYFGDFPYSEAFLGAENLAPKADPGEDIYADIEALLDEAIANFGKEQAADVANDFFYNGDETKWVKLANTLKLKMYVQTKLVDASASSKINAIVNSGNYIRTADEDFQFNYSTVDVNPDSRHPLFSDNFDNGKTEYMSNWYMDLVVNQLDASDTEIDDPRRRYYLYRQSDDFSAADSQTQPCTQESKPSHYSDDDPFCQVTSTFGDGYWGRDHGDNDGIPPDDGDVCLFGVYPIGGEFDADAFIGINDRNIGLEGAGSSMMMLSSYVDFMLAETALTHSVTGDPRTYLEQGITKSISKVTAFGEQLDLDSAVVEDDPDTAEDEEIIPRTFVPSSTDITNYIAAILAKYDAADDDGKLEIIVEQYFLALFGNGIEAYNTYRRTGKPDLQPTLLASPGIYIRTFPYPDALVNRNSNVSSKPISTQVFWDTNASNFID
ncbi:SusD/RagB family nutrient-binding outer membrane lipoprotein [Aquimarina pacifica]|uniref:SusD/RagB family nutrient-binding outer membrane lipoprotein n=1 Tax=Aquimarina pacifica TaxID=1296415 RepID=UPI00047084D9|nr:SusD/RagB family nutrient-binding outer membrane lipoprotein [Aquimarina pacifica]